MAQTFPDGIQARHLGKARDGLLTFRWRAIVVLGAIMALALSGLLGGAHPEHSEKQVNGNRLAVDAPGILRSGLFFEMIATVQTPTGISKPELAFSENYLRDVTVNTVMPDPAQQGFEDGAYTFGFDALKPGEVFKVKLDAQVNPTLGGGGGEGWMELRDDGNPLVRVPLKMTVLP